MPVLWASSDGRDVDRRARSGDGFALRDGHGGTDGFVVEDRSTRGSEAAVWLSADGEVVGDGR